MRNFALGAVLWALCVLIGRGFIEPQECAFLVAQEKQYPRSMSDPEYRREALEDSGRWVAVFPALTGPFSVSTGLLLAATRGWHGFGYGCLDKMAKEAK